MWHLFLAGDTNIEGGETAGRRCLHVVGLVVSLRSSQKGGRGLQVLIDNLNPILVIQETVMQAPTEARYSLCYTIGFSALMNYHYLEIAGL